MPTKSTKLVTQRIKIISEYATCKSTPLPNIDTGATMRAFHQTTESRTCTTIAVSKAPMKAGKDQNFTAIETAGTVSLEIEKHLLDGATTHNKDIEPNVTTIPVIRAPEKIIAATYIKRSVHNLTGLGL
jgi:hypothetical protein